MKLPSTLVTGLLLVGCLGASRSAHAQCAAGQNWTQSWTDAYGQTTYTLEAPCVVYIGVPFTITGTVTDSVYPNSTVAYDWSILDNGVVVAGGGFNWVDLVSGQWQQVLTETYSGTPINHTIEFRAYDLGQGMGAHAWGGKVIGSVVVDPYPPGFGNSPPTADAGPDVAILDRDQPSTRLLGSASDPDGDPLTYRWFEGTTELSASAPIDGGSATLDLATVPPLAIGSHALSLEVSDGMSTSTAAMTLTVLDSPPEVAPTGSGTYEINTPVALAGTVSDFEGESVSYAWLEGSTVLSSGTVATVPGGAAVALPALTLSHVSLGAHVFVLRASDPTHTVEGSVSVGVVDTTPPTLAPVATPGVLWPADGSWVQVVVAAHAADNSGGPVALTASVSSTDPGSASDATVVGIDPQAGTVTLSLRAARLGATVGRVYTILVTGTDPSGNHATATAEVLVPHDLGRRPAVAATPR